MSRNALKSSAGRGRYFRIALWGGAAFVLLLPLVAMQFTDEMVWDRADFAVFGVMLVAACGCYELARKITRNSAYRVAIGIAIAAVFILVWLELAVGLVGN